MNKGIKIFELDSTGKLIKLRGIKVPSGLIHVVSDGLLEGRSPELDTSWVVRGAYKFAKKVQGIDE